MVEFLIARGARPVEKESWASMAGLLLSRAWLVKTLCESEREGTADWIIDIMGILVKAGWDVNEPVDASGKTMLHHAVGFWSGQYKWDLQLRSRVSGWLCDVGADPGRRDGKGRTPMDVAVQSEDRELMGVLERGVKSAGRVAYVELAG